MPDERPAAIAETPDARQVHLDVRPDIERGEEPFTRIMSAVKALGEGEVFVLHVPFEPIPLYGVLGRLGFAHWAECRSAKDWTVWFYRAPAAAPPAATPPVPGPESRRP